MLLHCHPSLSEDVTPATPYNRHQSPKAIARCAHHDGYLENFENPLRRVFHNHYRSILEPDHALE